MVQFLAGGFSRLRWRRLYKKKEFVPLVAILKDESRGVEFDIFIEVLLYVDST